MIGVVEIPLLGAKARGRVALIDHVDYPVVSAHRWYVYEADRPGRRPSGPYAVSNGGRIRMHKLLTGWPQTDHINLNGLDNRRVNLRSATTTQNNRNQRSIRGSSSQYKGVFWYKRGSKWSAQIKIDRKPMHLGYFADEVDAARVYDAAAHEAWGEYAFLNFPVKEEY